MNALEEAHEAAIVNGNEEKDEVDKSQRTDKHLKRKFLEDDSSNDEAVIEKPSQVQLSVDLKAKALSCITNFYAC
jgi:hypothetical protein